MFVFERDEEESTGRDVEVSRSYFQELHRRVLDSLMGSGGSLMVSNRRSG